jgi:hypothetical protein
MGDADDGRGDSEDESVAIGDSEMTGDATNDAIGDDNKSSADELTDEDETNAEG